MSKMEKQTNKKKTELDLKPVSSLNTSPYGPETRPANWEDSWCLPKAGQQPVTDGEVFELNCFNMCIGKAAVQG